MVEKEKLIPGIVWYWYLGIAENEQVSFLPLRWSDRPHPFTHSYILVRFLFSLLKEQKRREGKETEHTYLVTKVRLLFFLATKGTMNLRMFRTWLLCLFFSWPRTHDLCSLFSISKEKRIVHGRNLAWRNTSSIYRQEELKEYWWRKSLEKRVFNYYSVSLHCTTSISICPPAVYGYLKKPVSSKLLLSKTLKRKRNLSFLFSSRWVPGTWKWTYSAVLFDSYLRHRYVRTGTYST